jgi:general secretion pathway protein D
VREAWDTIDTERKAAVARSRYYLDVGRKFYEEMKYVEARENLKRAAGMDPFNKEAAELLEKVNDVLGDRTPQIKTSMERLADLKRVAVQEKLIELDNALAHARMWLRKVEEGDRSLGIEKMLAEQVRYASLAVEHAERAREIVKWMPYVVKVDDKEEEAESILFRARDVRDKKLAVLHEEKIKMSRQQVEARRAEDERLQERKIDKLLDQVEMFFDQEKYEQAEKLAKEILKMDPTNFRANELWMSAREQQHLKREAELRAVGKEEKVSLDEDMEEAAVPYSELVVYPGDWERIALRESVQAMEAAEPQWKKEIRKMLERKVTFEFVDTPLQEAIQFLQTLTRTTIILDPMALEDSAAASTPITLRVNDMSLGLALRWILRLADLDYTLKDEAVFISTPQRLAGEVELKIYDVRDLTHTITQFPGPELVLAEDQSQYGGGGVGGPIDISEDETVVAFEAGSLGDLIRERVRPTEWAAELGTSIEERDGKLVVMQKPEIHRLISQLLKTFRESQTLQVMVGSRFIEVRDSFIEDIGIEFADLPPEANGAYDNYPGILPNDNVTELHPVHPFAGPTQNTTGLVVHEEQALGEYDYWVRSTAFTNREYPFNAYLPFSTLPRSGHGATFQFRFLGNVAMQAIMHALSKTEKGDLLLAPRVAMYNNQRAHILVATQQPYISDYDATGAVYDPVVSTIMTGTVLDIRPTVSHDRRYITLNLKPATADNLRFTPFAIESTYGGGGGPNQRIYLEIQLPHIRLRSVRTTVTVPDGGTVLVSGLMTDLKFEAASGVPFFSDLPVVGRLFGTDLRQREKINLLVLVTANLILFEEEEAKL